MTCVLLSRDIGGVFIDVVISEQHESELEVAQHPIERGAEITDHAWRKARTVTLEGVIASERARAGYQALFALQKKPELFTLVTGLEIYQTMLLQSLSAERSAEYSQVLKFTATAQEVIVVSTQTTGRSSTEKANAKTNRGEVQARKVEPGLTPSGQRAETILQGAY
ncbi:hypothetical protein FHT98_0623 [Bosea sp. AK1]|uniref:phage baseplate protein n=1 Tax=Bosea sp. AK1 TaxID=2587160 RepID=UPI0011547178|nr:hypothetical protein [Bosea sp. AK1]TQI72903.1 hypothetical protein FHT98_0623 [Bosea sp. AK1]